MLKKKSKRNQSFSLMCCPLYEHESWVEHDEIYHSNVSQQKTNVSHGLFLLLLRNLFGDSFISGLKYRVQFLVSLILYGAARLHKKDFKAYSYQDSAAIQLPNHKPDNHSQQGKTM